MASEIRQKCVACESTQNVPINLKFGYEGKICLNCNLVWAVNVLGTKQLYESAYDKNSQDFVWQSYLDAYERVKSTQRASFYWFEQYFLKKNRPFGSKNLLEIGCGVGRFLLGCKNTGWQIHGLDISDKAVEMSKKLMPDDDFQIGTVEESKWPKESFEAITCWEVIEHVNDPFIFVSKIKELLTNDGIFAFSTPDWDNWLIRRNPRKNYWPPFHNWFFSEKSIKALLERAGLKIIKIKRRLFPWGETNWPRWRRILSIPWLIYKGVILNQGGGRLVVLAKKP
ncbi:MAG: class I SAM-dependent methyltransferase [Sedimentisphaerales bacterium]|nr:class I SAM-dependent methyltransferase [Sedimentisphaerales bacterium]